jgi:heme exporter protein C
MSDTRPADVPASRGPGGGAFPGMAGPPSGGFLLHALLALAALVALDALIAWGVPGRVKQLGSSYLIMYYHVPAAIWTGILLAFSAICALLLLTTSRSVWDRRSAAFASVGLLANGITLLTGSVWGATAWNTPWVWEDPQLLSAAMLFLVWAGYLLLRAAAADDDRRERFCAVYAICALAIVPLVKFAPEWFGVASHPKSVGQKNDMMATASLVATWVAFPLFYTLLYRWKFDRDAIAERAENCLARLRRIEETPR